MYVGQEIGNISQYGSADPAQKALVHYGKCSFMKVHFFLFFFVSSTWKGGNLLSDSKGQKIPISEKPNVKCFSATNTHALLIASTFHYLSDSGDETVF